MDRGRGISFGELELDTSGAIDMKTGMMPTFTAEKKEGLAIDL